MRTKRASSVASTSPIIHSDAHGDLRRGDSVKVAGERGRWEFRSYCVNADTGSEWLDVFGGTPGCETIRAFKIERVSPLRKRRKK